MKPLDEIYNRRFFARRYKMNWRAPIICLTIETVLGKIKIERVIDLGCANGDLVAEWTKRGYEALGVEGSSHIKDYMEDNASLILADLRSPLPDNLKNFDLVTCFEVLEHIEEEYSEMVVDNICYLTKKFVVTSAAPPGQGGHYHVNCQDKKYWIDKFEKRSFEYNDRATGEIRAMLDPWKSKPGIKAIHQNLMVFNYFLHGEG